VSRRLAVLNAILRRLVLPSLRRQQDPVRARRAFDRAALALPAPRGARARRDAATGLTWAGQGGKDGPGASVVLYLHGGGYIAGSAWTHRGVIGRLSQASGVPVCAPDYRLAPEHPHPAALDDARAAHATLRAQGIAHDRIALAGDSAGGGLALALLAELCAAGTPPAAAVAFSPWTDLTCSGASLRDNAGRDVLLPAERIGDLVGFVLGPAGDAADPGISPLFADFPGCPPVLIQASRAEILRDDALRMAGTLRAAGAEVDLQLWDATPHAWQIFGDGLPESRDAVAAAGRFLRRNLSPSG
jgi:epsilon-lactone hydrolase